MVVSEFKGETSAATRKARKKLGHRVVEIAPFDGGKDCLNPLDFIDKNSPTALEECLDLAKFVGHSYRNGTYAALGRFW